MGKTTEYLGLYEAADTDFYNVEKDQNENFTILDEKAKEVDEALLSAKGYTDGLAGNVIDSFPLSNAAEGKVYREPQNRKYYICTKNYSGGLISLPNANFEELSIWRNREKINGLFKMDSSNSGVYRWESIELGELIIVAGYCGAPNGRWTYVNVPEFSEFLSGTVTHDYITDVYCGIRPSGNNGFDIRGTYSGDSKVGLYFTVVLKK